MDLFTAHFRDLGGGLNPTGIWSVAFLRLKAAVEQQMPLEVLEHALYAWMESRGIEEDRLDALLELQPEEAAREFGIMTRMAVQKGELPDQLQGLVTAAFQRIITARIEQAGQALEQDYIERRGKLDAARQRHGIQATATVEALLA